MRALIIMAFIISSVPFGTGTANAETPAVRALTDVAFVGTDEALRFSFTADGALAADGFSAKVEGSVLVLSLPNARTSRRWLKLSDPDVVRTLLHPTRGARNIATLRVRMKTPMPAVILENIMVQGEGGAVVVLVPRTAEVAARWAAVAQAPAPRIIVSKVEQAPVKVVIAPSAAPVVKVEATPIAEGERPESEILLEPVTPEASAEALPLEDSVGEDAPSTSGPSLGVMAMSMLFLLFIGTVMWRKLRKKGGPTGNGPLIRTVGTHMIGPKQSLMLVDVAGQMVLLGTSDKGVQMLTRIDRDLEANLDLSAAETPEPAEEPGFADRLGMAFSKVRAAAQGIDPRVATEPVERAFFAREKAAVREAADEDALAALCDAVQDEAPTPRLRPVPDAAASDVSRDAAAANLLQKIRRLQTA